MILLYIESDHYRAILKGEFISMSLDWTHFRIAASIHHRQYCLCRLGTSVQCLHFQFIFYLILFPGDARYLNLEPSGCTADALFMAYPPFHSSINGHMKLLIWKYLRLLTQDWKIPGDLGAKPRVKFDEWSGVVRAQQKCDARVHSLKLPLFQGIYVCSLEGCHSWRTPGPTLKACQMWRERVHFMLGCNEGLNTWKNLFLKLVSYRNSIFSQWQLSSEVIILAYPTGFL